MGNIIIWGYSIPSEWLLPEEINYLQGLPTSLPSLEWVWMEIDRIWDSCGLDNNSTLSSQPIAEFYRHPVWLMNGIFTALDPLSLSQRISIAHFIDNSGARVIADYGGGFGELARTIVKTIADASVSIVEPFPSKVGLERLKNESKINFVPNLDGQKYDAIIVQDVLEHVEEPALLAYQISNAVKTGGIVVFANCFYPVIKCHLPSTFHLRHTFCAVMKSAGLNYIGRIEGAEYAHVFKRSRSLTLNYLRHSERVSKTFGPLVNIIFAFLSKFKLFELRL